LLVKVDMTEQDLVFKFSKNKKDTKMKLSEIDDDAKQIARDWLSAHFDRLSFLVRRLRNVKNGPLKVKL